MGGLALQPQAQDHEIRMSSWLGGIEWVRKRSLLQTESKVSSVHAHLIFSHVATPTAPCTEVDLQEMQTKFLRDFLLIFR